jgi:hypothetical protein
MLKTPWRALNSRFSIEVSPYWQPSFIKTFLGAGASFPEAKAGSAIDVPNANPPIELNVIALTKPLRSIVFALLSEFSIYKGLVVFSLPMIFNYFLCPS